MQEFTTEFFKLLANGGWQAVTGLAIYLVYKTSMTGLIAYGAYKGFCRFMIGIESFSLARKCAVAMKTETPLTAWEEAYILEAIIEKRGKKNAQDNG